MKTLIDERRYDVKRLLDQQFSHGILNNSRGWKEFCKAFGMCLILQAPPLDSSTNLLLDAWHANGDNQAWQFYLPSRESTGSTG